MSFVFQQRCETWIYAMSALYNSHFQCLQNMIYWWVGCLFENIQCANLINILRVCHLASFICWYIPRENDRPVKVKPLFMLSLTIIVYSHTSCQRKCVTFRSPRRTSIGHFALAANFRTIKLEPTWWRHLMETFSALLAICARDSPVTGEFPSQRPVTRSFDVFFDLRLNKQLTTQSRRWWFETPWRPLSRQCYEGPPSVA